MHILIPDHVNVLLYRAKESADVIEVKDLEMGEFILDYGDGLNVTTSIL